MFENDQVSIWINCVEMFERREFLEFNQNSLARNLIVNCFPYAFILEKLVPLMKLNAKRSAIINISSDSIR